MKIEKTDTIFDFEGEESRRLDKDHIINRLAQLRADLSSAQHCRSYKGGHALFSLNFLMADILDCLDLLSFNNLSAILGRDAAATVWPDVRR